MSSSADGFGVFESLASVRGFGNNLLIPQLVHAEMKEQEDARRAAAAAARAERQTVVDPPDYEEVEAADDAMSPRQAQARSRVEIFRMEDLKVASKAVDERDRHLIGGIEVLKAMSRDDGFRELPSMRAIGRIRGLTDQFANMAEAIDRLSSELTLARAMRPADFRVTPILLVGAPGLGKTYFARTLASAIDVDFEVLSAGGVQGGFVLAGTSSHWSNASPGGVARLLSRSMSASPVLVLDEIDKLGGDQSTPTMPALLDLLETGSARHYRDEALQLRFDASKLISLLTANELADVPTPLLSRVEVIEVPRPSVEQRLAIVTREWEQLRKGTRRKIALAAGQAEVLAEREDLDLRKTTRILRDAFAMAVQDKELMAKLVMPAAPRTKVMGFGGGS